MVSFPSWFSRKINTSSEDGTSTSTATSTSGSPSIDDTLGPAAQSQDKSHTETYAIDEKKSLTKELQKIDLALVSLPALPSFIEPSHVLFGLSAPFYYRAYRLYRSRLDNLVQTVAQKNQISIAELEAADISVRNAVGSAVAGRALRLATLISFGSFGMFTAAIFLVFDWKSIQEGVHNTRQWGKRHRKKLDEVLGVKERIDDEHPEMIARRTMTPEEESAYLLKRYWLAKNATPNHTKDVESKNE